MPIMTTNEYPKFLIPEDLKVLTAILNGNEWLRAALCTLARRGIAFRQAHPERAKYFLETLSGYPIFKAGQFLFDLMEWEDFMLDGPPLALLPTALDSESAARILKLLNSIKAHIDGAVTEDVATLDPGMIFTYPHEDLPPLEGGFYLYQDVVIGIIESFGSLIRATNETRA